jgi:hypothetical protein
MKQMLFLVIFAQKQVILGIKWPFFAQNHLIFIISPKISATKKVAISTLLCLLFY